MELTKYKTCQRIQPKQFSYSSQVPQLYESVRRPRGGASGRKEYTPSDNTLSLFSRNSHKYTISTPKWLQVVISHWNSHIFPKSSDSIRGSYFFAVPDLEPTHFNFLCGLITLYAEEVMRMGMNFAEMHPELASEFSERNLPLTVSDITYGSNKKRSMWKNRSRRRKN